MNLRRTLAGITAAGLGGLAAPALAQGYGPGYGYGGMMGYGWHGWLFGPLMMVLWIAVIAGIVVLVVRWLGGGRPQQAGSGSSARAILDERFARGEIEEAEYRARRQALDGG